MSAPFARSRIQSHCGAMSEKNPRCRNGVRDALNFTLQDMWKDGTWDKIYARWIGPGSKLNLEKSEIGFKMEIWE